MHDQRAYGVGVTDGSTADDASASHEAAPDDESTSVAAAPDDETASVAGEADDDVAPPAGRRRRRVLVSAAVLVLLLVAAGGVVAWRALTPDPRDVAKDYFARLAAGDANGALKAVDKGPLGAGLPASDPLLSDAALHDPASRPVAMTIARVSRHNDAATLTVQYKANGSTITQTLEAKRQGRRFVLESPLVRLSFTNLAAGNTTRVTVNGVAVDPAKGGPAFPGAYAVAVEGNALFAGRSATAVPSAEAIAVVKPAPASLSPDGRTKADAAVAAALQQCVVNHFQPQPACPQVIIFQPGGPASGLPAGGTFMKGVPAGTITTTLGTVVVAGKITRLPICTYTADADSVDHVTFSSVNGAVHWDIHLSLADGTSLTGQHTDVPIAPKGRVDLDANGRLKVSFA
jgi:hypothetical protein